jgi:hypothetical protein
LIFCIIDVEPAPPCMLPIPDVTKRKTDDRSTNDR